MSQRDEKLDLIRGLSALAVLAAHVRAIVFVDYAESNATGTAAQGFYFITSIHHQAVMVFFVLSGYFVGGSVLHTLRRNSFTWQRYATARLTRLWLVLIPALLFTLAIDTLGRALYADAYTGAFHSLWVSGPSPGHPIDHSLATFFGNSAFLQTIQFPIFGSNGPLWSLANEFWYYVAFPLFACGGALLRRKELKRFIGLLPCLIGIGILVWLPNGIVTHGLIWLLGVAVWVASNSMTYLSCKARLIWFVVGLGGFLTTLYFSKTASPLGSDLAVGLAFAIWMPTLLGTWKGANWLRPIGKYLSEISYTLYVTHFPIVILMGALWVGRSQYHFGVGGIFVFSTICLTCLVSASAMWWLFEKRTPVVRRAVCSRLRID